MTSGPICFTGGSTMCSPVLVESVLVVWHVAIESALKKPMTKGAIFLAYAHKQPPNSINTISIQ